MGPGLTFLYFPAAVSSREYRRDPAQARGRGSPRGPFQRTNEGKEGRTACLGLEGIEVHTRCHARDIPHIHCSPSLDVHRHRQLLWASFILPFAGARQTSPRRGDGSGGQGRVLRCRLGQRGWPVRFDTGIQREEAAAIRTGILRISSLSAIFHASGTWSGCVRNQVAGMS